MRAWGYHLMLDCRKCDSDAVISPETIYNFTKELVERIDMVAFGEPQIVHFAEQRPDLAGYTLVQLIETSNITAHFMDESCDAYIDIFSCKQFNIEDAIEVVEKYFMPEKMKRVYIERQA